MSKYKKYLTGLIGLTVAALITATVIASGAGTWVVTNVKKLLNKSESDTDGFGAN
jgi:hypothetical protein